MKVAVIGAGVIGLLSALELAEQGVHVDLFDQRLAGAEASWAGGGILSPMYPWRYPSAVNALAQSAKTMYQTWNEKLKPVTEIDFEIHHSGMLIFDENDFALGLSYADQSQNSMQHAQLLQASDILNTNPHISTQFKQALFFPHLANIRNPKLLQSLVCYLKQLPHVQWHEHTQITQLHFEHQRLQHIQDQHGHIYTADEFVFSTGAWSHQFSQQLNIHIPVQPIQGQMALFKAPPGFLPTMCMNEVMYLIPRADGHIVCGSSMQDIGFNKDISPSLQQHILDASYQMVPALKKMPLIQQWAGLRPSSPHGIPYIGVLPHLNNVWLNTGHFRNGLCMGPASAQLLRQLMLQQPLSVDPNVYNPSHLI